MRLFASLAAALCLLLPAGAFAKAADTSIYPEHTSAMGLVNDFAGVMTDAQKAPIEAKLRSFANTTHAQVVVVTVVSLHGIPISDYGHELFKRWGPGMKGADNGVLFLIAPNDHRMRIDVGTRLEPYLTDAMSRIILKGVHDANHANGIPAGIAVGADQIIALLGPALAQDHNEPMKHAATPKARTVPFFLVVLGVIVIVLILALGMGLLLRNPPEEEEPDETLDDELAKSRYGVRGRDYPFRSDTADSAAIIAGAETLSHRHDEEPHYDDDDDPVIGSSDSSSNSGGSDDDDGVELGGGKSSGGGAEDDT